ncbi:hypothetical protein R1sor_018680 [Riccia sorocarpa]|uniref:Chloroplast J-like domain 1 n=1 Tax=Riccia sorocarpa TaxID=122646 RepID=A0ABD3IAC7_9MARC
MSMASTASVPQYVAARSGMLRSFNGQASLKLGECGLVATCGAWRRVRFTALQNSRLREFRTTSRRLSVNCSAAGASSAGDQSTEDESPYQVLGVSPFEQFDAIKAVYNRRYKDAEKRGDEAAMARFERAYDKLLMAQLTNRKKGRTFGDFEVSKEIRYADKRVLFPWGPKIAPSSKNDVLINLAASAVIAIWITVTQVAEWKPLQFLMFGYVFRIFLKLKEYEPPTSVWSEEDEDSNSKRRQKNGMRLLRTLALVLSCVAIASLAFTGILNGYELAGAFIPRKLLHSQELFVTVGSSILLFFTGSYLR